jgi:hypothetical protein
MLRSLFATALAVFVFTSAGVATAQQFSGEEKCPGCPVGWTCVVQTAQPHVGEARCYDVQGLTASCDAARADHNFCPREQICIKSRSGNTICD